MELEIKEKGLNKVLIRFQPWVWGEARKAALSDVTKLLRKKTKEYIESGGEGSFPAHHPLTSTRRLGTDDKWHRRKIKRTGWGWMAKHLRITTSKTRGRVKLGPLDSNDTIGMSAVAVEKGHVTRVTSPMRRKLGAGGYPLRKTTTSLEIKPHPVMKPVAKKYQVNLAVRFGKIYVQEVGK